jgi:hypothetical protein
MAHEKEKILSEFGTEKSVRQFRKCSIFIKIILTHLMMAM